MNWYHNTERFLRTLAARADLTKAKSAKQHRQDQSALASPNLADGSGQDTRIRLISITKQANTDFGRSGFGSERYQT
jgi:hypothetical protein